MKPWKFLSKELVLKTHLFHVFKAVFKSNDSNQEGVFDVLETKDWVNVIAITPDDKVILVRQFRFGTQEVTLEFPAGAIDLGEDPSAAAKRELLEETGSIGSSLSKIGQCRPNPAFLNNTCYHYVAKGVEFKTKQKLDDLEEVSFELMSIDNVDKMIANGTINHSLSIAAWSFFLRTLSPPDQSITKSQAKIARALL